MKHIVALLVLAFMVIGTPKVEALTMTELKPVLSFTKQNARYWKPGYIYRAGQKCETLHNVKVAVAISYATAIERPYSTSNNWWIYGDKEYASHIEGINDVCGALKGQFKNIVSITGVPRRGLAIWFRNKSGTPEQQKEWLKNIQLAYQQMK